jgi:hypothetical protein
MHERIMTISASWSRSAGHECNCYWLAVQIETNANLVMGWISKILAEIKGPSFSPLARPIFPHNISKQRGSATRYTNKYAVINLFITASKFIWQIICIVLVEINIRNTKNVCLGDEIVNKSHPSVA